MTDLALDRGIPPGMTLSSAQARDLAVATESGAWDGLWVSEARHDPFLPLAVAAEHTSRITLGTSIAVAFARSPMTTAYTAYDLQRLSGGRFVLGLGSQVQPHVVRRFGMPWSAPAARMRDYVQSLRAIWGSWRTGERLDHRGEYYQHTLMTPFFSPPALVGPDPRVFLAAVGPAMTRVAGEVTDGVILHGFTTPEYIREVSLPALAEGRAASGRSADAVEVSMMCFIVTGADDAAMDRAARAVREQIGFYGSTPAYRGVMDLHGWGDQAERLSGMARRGDWSDLGDVITDDMLERFAVIAPLGEVATALTDRFARLVDRLSFYVPYDADPAMWDDVAARMR